MVQWYACSDDSKIKLKWLELFLTPEVKATSVSLLFGYEIKHYIFFTVNIGLDLGLEWVAY